MTSNNRCTSGQQVSRQLPIVVLDPLAVAEISLPAATQGRGYAAQLVATGGDGAYTWSVESGTLPTGVELSSGGALTGTPADGGAFTFTARVTDGADRAATRSITLTVERAPTIQTGSLPPGDIGEQYSAQLTATGGRERALLHHRRADRRHPAHRLDIGRHG